MRAKLSRLFIFVAIVLLAITITALQLLLKSCFWWDCAPQRSFSVFDLSIPESYYPSGIIPDKLSNLRINGPISEAGSTTSLKYGRAIFLVYQFASLQQAIEWFQEDAGNLKWVRQFENSSEMPTIMTYTPSFANEFLIECGIHQSSTRCSFDARYQEFTIYYSAHIGPDSLNEDQFVAILGFLDSRFERILSPAE